MDFIRYELIELDDEGRERNIIETFDEAKKNGYIMDLINNLMDKLYESTEKGLNDFEMYDTIYLFEYSDTDMYCDQSFRVKIIEDPRLGFYKRINQICDSAGRYLHKIDNIYYAVKKGKEYSKPMYLPRSAPS